MSKARYLFLPFLLNFAVREEEVDGEEAISIGFAPIFFFISLNLPVSMQLFWLVFNLTEEASNDLTALLSMTMYYPVMEEKLEHIESLVE